MTDAEWISIAGRILNRDYGIHAPLAAAIAEKLFQRNQKLPNGEKQSPAECVIAHMLTDEVLVDPDDFQDDDFPARSEADF